MGGRSLKLSWRTSKNVKTKYAESSRHSGGNAPKVLGKSRSFARCARLGSRLYWARTHETRQERRS
jgi:hypothetical protein